MTDSVLWHNDFDQSAELCRLLETTKGYALEGTVLVPVEGRPARAEYRVEADPTWTTQRARLRLDTTTSTRELSLTSDGMGIWTVDGDHRPALDGCVDVDLRVTAATNTLPVRRLAPAVGEVVETRAAWVGFPELDVVVSIQSYERLGETTYRFRSGDFVADLEVDDAGLVLRYGDRGWRAVAHDHGPPAGS